MALYRENRGDRPVTAVIYTHSHIDHFGGCWGSSIPTRRFRSSHPNPRSPTSWALHAPNTCSPRKPHATRYPRMPRSPGRTWQPNRGRHPTDSHCSGCSQYERESGSNCPGDQLTVMQPVSWNEQNSLRLGSSGSERAELEPGFDDGIGVE
jgi:hypothetical protein